MLRDQLMKYAISDNQLKVIGSPRHDRFFLCNNLKADFVLIAANGFFHPNFNGNDTNAFERLELYVKKIFEQLKKYPNKKDEEIAVESEIPLFFNTIFFKLLNFSLI